MAGQMCWLPQSGKDGEKILHLRTAPHEAWRPYTAFGQYAVQDYDIPGGSKGFATYQKRIISLCDRQSLNNHKSSNIVI
jgi:hypothetical protein